MGEQTVTHRDLARALGVSETTIKSYRSKFPTFLPVAREGKPVRLHAEALKVCLRIRELFAEGLSILHAAEALRSEFKEYPSNRRLSTAKKSAAQPAVSPAGQGQESALAERIAQMAAAQDQARLRMEQLEAEVRNLATLEAASKALVAELLTELRAAKAASAVQEPAAPVQTAPPAAARTQEPAPEAAPAGAQVEAAPDPFAAAAAADEEQPTVLTARKIVTVHGPAGPVASYALGREPRPEPPFPEPAQPDKAFLDLPAVIRSERGDFLGLPGGQSVRRLVEVLSPEGAAPAAWFQDTPEAWTCAIPLGRAQNREILFERTTTPRGNLVGLIRRMRINEAEATPVQLQEIFRQLRDQMS
ncbi:MAG: MerR family transcriptional regulator [Desulfovibrio sp.]|jgi:hypothetical protein|nr:MerR family transcriptional regulator [Desulfovibrio sp.]